jgi:C_GCAxxG_C_C family probable redox protein
MKKDNLSEKAIKRFREGYNCAQSTLYVFTVNTMDETLALNISAGFGVGMGRKQEVCGAISGAIMVLGLKYGNDGNDSKEKINNVYKKARYLIERFTKEKGTVNCRELLNGCDLSTDEGQEYFQKNNLKENNCCEYIALTCRILEEIMEENS